MAILNDQVTLLEYNTLKDGINRIMSRAFAVIKPHIPLIKFRKGNLAKGLSASPIQALETPSSSLEMTDAVAPIFSAQPVTGPKLSMSSIAPKWSELPGNYRKQDIDQLECDRINSGGTEKT